MSFRPTLCLAIHFMLRAAALHLFLRGLQRFSTISHPIALAACYVTACLPAGLTVTTTGLAPVSRRQLSGHTSALLCALVGAEIPFSPENEIDRYS